ncbi:hypothetical protein BH09SUM1_BH09SUM1_14620 [soil metagenome]
MQLRLLPGVICSLFLVSQIFAEKVAEKVMEDRVRVRYLEPSVILQRVQYLAGIPPEGDRRLMLRGDDAADTIVIQIPESYGDPMERERMRLMLRDYIARLDAPDPTVDLDIYLVQSNLLTDEEFKTLDAALRKGPLKLPKGSTSKGVVFHREMETPNLSLISISEEQKETRASTRPEPVRVVGRVLPSVRPDGRVYIVAALTATAMQKPFAQNKSELPINERAIASKEQPLVIVAGEKITTADGQREAFPGRHEVMLYIWARSVEPPEKKAIAAEQ